MAERVRVRVRKKEKEQAQENFKKNYVIVCPCIIGSRRARWI